MRQPEDVPTWGLTHQLSLSPHPLYSSQVLLVSVSTLHPNPAP